MALVSCIAGAEKHPGAPVFLLPRLARESLGKACARVRIPGNFTLSRRLEFAQRQRDGTARSANGRWETAHDAHEQGENDAADEKSRCDAEGES